MTAFAPETGHSLRGKTILLSASVPTVKRAERYNRIADAAFEIEQAVISLARAVFSEGGCLVFGGHPAISPLVAMVVGEYREPRFSESRDERQVSPVEIFQSRAFEGYLPDDTLLMYRLGYASIRWVESVGNERYSPDAEDKETPCSNSLRRMRQVMLETRPPDAVVCIGGMEGLEQEVDLALERTPTTPIFVLERTGGAAGLLDQRHDRRLRMIDTEVMLNLDRIRESSELINRDAHPERRALVPYPLVMQQIVAEMTRNNR